MIHNLKCHDPYFQDIIDGKKRFEVRKNDRNFQVGDILRLQEYAYLGKGEREYTGRERLCLATYVLGDIVGMEGGFVVMSIDAEIIKGIKI